MSTIANPYLPEEVAGYQVPQVEGFIADAREASMQALGPARQLFDSSRARPIAVALEEALLRPGVLFQAFLAERRRLQADTTRRVELVRDDWAAFCAQTKSDGQETEKAIATGIAELQVALEAEALPVSADPQAVLVARQEIDLALTVAPDNALQVFLQLAARGGDISAAAASEWGRLRLTAAQGNDTGFDQVAAEATRAAVNSVDEQRRRAAVALQATQTPRAGQTSPPLRESQTLGMFVLHVVYSGCEMGLVIG